jgi:hypothetical protein
MKLGFTELRPFMRFRAKHMRDEVLRELQTELMHNPLKGDLIRGTNGLRKVQARDEARGKGTRGGVRVIYLHIPEIERIVFVYGYTKELQEDLSPEEAKELGSLVGAIKAEEVAFARSARK